MKKLLLFIFALFLWTGAWADKTVWLNPGSFEKSSETHSWDEAGAVVEAWVWETGHDGRWVSPTYKMKVSGTTYYKFVVNNNEDRVIFHRAGTVENAHKWNNDDVWAEVKPGDDGTFANNTLYTITDWNSYDTSGPFAGDPYSGATKKTIYLHPNSEWKAANAVFSVYAYTDDDNNCWIPFSALEGAYNCYVAEVPTNCSNMILVRGNGEKAPTMTFVNRWNQTKTSIDISKTPNNTLFKITAIGDGNNNSTYEISNNLALLGTASASFNNINAYQSNDGNTGSRWGSEGGTDTEWYQIGWANAQTFNTIKILCEGAMNHTYSPGLAFDIQTSDDGDTWTTRKHVWGKNGDGTYISVVLNEPVTAKYVRFQGLTKGDGGLYGYSFWEFEVYNLDYSGETLNSITLSAYKNHTTTSVGKNIALSVIGYNSSSEEIPTGIISWSDVSSIGNVVNETFNATTEGTATLTATAGGKTSGDITFTITAHQELGRIVLPHLVYSATQGFDVDALVYDTEDNVFESDVTLSWNGPAPVGAVITGKHISFGAASGQGNYTLQATDGYTTITTPVYMVGNSDALITPANNVVPIYAAGTNTEWVIDWNGKAIKDHSFTLGTTPVQSFYDTRCVFVTNKDLNAWNDDVNPTEEGYGSIHFSIYSPIDGVKVNISFEGTNTIGNDHLMTLSQGWGEYSVSLVGETNIHTISIRNEQKSSSTAGPTIVVANVYYTKVAINPSTIESVTVTAASTSIAEGKTTQLTVTDQLERDVTSLMTFASSDTGVATVDATGLVTAEAKGSAKITATVTGREVSSTVNITVTEAELGFDLTADNHTIHVTPYHIAGTTTYKLVITSETETLTGMGGSFWHVKGNDATNTQMNTEQAMTVNNGVITVTGTFESAPVVYTPLYVMMPGQVTYTTGIENVDLTWIEAVSVTVTDAGRATFSSTEKLDFSVSGVKAYIATSPNSESVTMKEVTRVPANTGLLVKGDEGEYAVAITTKTPDDVSANKLVSTANEAHTITGGEVGRAFVFGRKSGNVGFYKAADGKNVAKGKSYLLFDVAPSNALEFFAIDDEGETDGINKVNTLVETGVRYNLAGQRVGNDYKGIVIVNGRKVVIK